QASKAAASLGGKVVETAAMFTKEAANLILMMFVTIYAVFFFLVDGKDIMKKVFYYSPLETADENMLVDRFMAVSKATLKTCFLLGVLQGGLNGIAFAVAGIPSSLFWATCMAVLSVIPGIGAALVYVPASIVLIVQGQAVTGLVLLGFCGLVVGSLDNVLRPKLVGRDTRLPQLAVLVGTLGGIALFGMIGILLGPIVAALWLVLIELYGHTFRQELPPVGK
ncbi:MAG: AI-2E family transporter, partial [Deltaproteobacteria bacterium]